MGGGTRQKSDEKRAIGRQPVGEAIGRREGEDLFMRMPFIARSLRPSPLPPAQEALHAVEAVAYIWKI